MALGKFITIEGGEGAGKSTQVRRLKEALEAAGVEVLLTREPGGTWLSEQIRTLLKDQTEDPPCDRAELLLFLAARAQLVESVIRPALEKGVWVVSDRFSDSTIAYQGYGRGLSIEIIDLVNSFACKNLKPDLTFLLEIDPVVARARLKGREAATQTSADRIESAGDAFHARLARGFQDLARQEPWRIVKVDANGTTDEVFAEIWKSLKRIR